jgi:hypothetical protein
MWHPENQLGTKKAVADKLGLHQVSSITCQKVALHKSGSKLTGNKCARVYSTVGVWKAVDYV